MKGIVSRFIRRHPHKDSSTKMRHSYGFIATESGEDFYFSADALQGCSSVPTGAEVEFQIVRGNGPHKTQAANVTVMTLAE